MKLPLAGLCRIAVGATLIGARAVAAEWHQADGYRWMELSLPQTGKTGFTQMPSAQTGIAFSNRLSEAQMNKNRILQNGSGLALGDVDGDGRCDIYFCGLESANRLYRNLGNWKFEDITSTAGVACSGQFSAGAVLADVDGDGDLDLLVNSIGGGTRLFLNDGNGRFTELTQAGLARKYGAMSMALADIDGDGALDLYVANYRTTTIRSTGLDMLNVNGRRMLRPQDRDQYEITPEGFIREHGETDILYRNDGHGHFSPL